MIVLKKLNPEFCKIPYKYTPHLPSSHNTIPIMPATTRYGRTIKPVKLFQDEVFTPGSGFKGSDFYDQSFAGDDDWSDYFLCDLDTDTDEGNEFDDFIVNDDAYDNMDTQTDDEWCEYNHQRDDVITQQHVDICVYINTAFVTVFSLIHSIPTPFKIVI